MHYLFQLKLLYVTKKQTSHHKIYSLMPERGFERPDFEGMDGSIGSAGKKLDLPRTWIGKNQVGEDDVAAVYKKLDGTGIDKNMELHATISQRGLSLVNSLEVFMKRNVARTRAIDEHAFGDFVKSESGFAVRTFENAHSTLAG